MKAKTMKLINEHYIQLVIDDGRLAAPLADHLESTGIFRVASIHWFDDTTLTVKYTGKVPEVAIDSLNAALNRFE